MPILLDSNVLLRQAEPLHPQHAVSFQATAELRRRGEDLVLVPQVLYEFWSVATRPVEQNGLGMRPSMALAELIAIQRLFRLMRDERAIYPVWEGLVSSHEVRGKKTHDARLAAAMLRHSIAQILTFNTADFSRYRHVAALSPADIVKEGGLS